MAKLKTRLWAPTALRHGGDNEQFKFNISTLTVTAPAGSYFELRLDNVAHGAEEAGETFHCPVMSNLSSSVSAAE